MSTATRTKTCLGTIIQVVGVMVDVEFADKQLLAINNALKMKLGDTILRLRAGRASQ